MSPVASTNPLPTARPAAEFIVETLTDEVLVYDQVLHHAHCLTPSAALVWRLCDGKTSPARAQAALAAAGHDDDVQSVVQQLVTIGIVRLSTPTRRRSGRQVDHSRRQLLARAAIAGVVVASPVVFSIVAPSVAEAASNCGAKTQVCCAGNTCNAGGKCVSGHCQ